MKESSYYHNGLFFYTPLYFEVYGLKAEVEHMEDTELVDSILHLCYNVDEIDEIIELYYKDFNHRLMLDERERLVWFYVLVNLEDYLILEEYTCTK